MRLYFPVDLIGNVNMIEKFLRSRKSMHMLNIVTYLINVPA